MTQIFFTSDTHFNHEVIIRYSQRPFADLSEMTEILVRNWNDRVGPGDIIYHLGDFAITFGPRRESKTDSTETSS
jgi:calcineurin-like phosphoesterase family protein